MADPKPAPTAKPVEAPLPGTSEDQRCYKQNPPKYYSIMTYQVELKVSEDDKFFKLSVVILCLLSSRFLLLHMAFFTAMNRSFKNSATTDPADTKNSRTKDEHHNKKFSETMSVICFPCKFNFKGACLSRKKSHYPSDSVYLEYLKISPDELYYKCHLAPSCLDLDKSPSVDDVPVSPKQSHLIVDNGLPPLTSQTNVALFPSILDIVLPCFITAFASSGGSMLKKQNQLHAKSSLFSDVNCYDLDI
ncbi:hypothetical protein KUTeg_001104 [Tegillarca granosa]|uniref:Uncharacterized protein n=1 Tax=Tegillarca granosa TaxID=220873 RepID=A0ABQ9G075_TEGGR|nr:hypothetical protein KUTeg_001104 [Tegillarca granosa]